MASLRANRSWTRIPAISYINPLPADLVEDAASLYLSSLPGKLVPVFGSGRRARLALAALLNRRMGIAAVAADRLVGMIGIQVEQAGFLDVRASSLIPHYGFGGSLWRLALLAIVRYTPLPDEAYIDGVVVDPSYRGRRIGTGLIRAAEAWARHRGVGLLSLEVVDSNPRARRLYQGVGFEGVQKKTAWPIGSLFGFQSSLKMVKLLDGPA